MSYGEIIRKLRKQKNMSLRDFGRLVGISHAHIQRIENEFSDKGKDKLKIPIDELKQICDGAKYPFRQFLEEAGYIEPVIAESSTFDKLFCELSPSSQEAVLISLEAAYMADKGFIPQEIEEIKAVFSSKTT